MRRRENLILPKAALKGRLKGRGHTHNCRLTRFEKKYLKAHGKFPTDHREAKGSIYNE